MRAAIFMETNGPLVGRGRHPHRSRRRATSSCASPRAASATPTCTVINGTLPMPPPAILGHEGAGVVEPVGSEVTGSQVGDRVIGSFIPACGVCWFCLRDQSNLCENTYTVMMRAPRDPRRRHAAHDDDRPRHVRRADDLRRDVAGQGRDRPPRRAARADRLRRDDGCRRGTQHREGRARLDTVAVIGCGGVGQAVIQGAPHRGRGARSSRSTRWRSKRDTALKLGATRRRSTRATATRRRRCMALTGGRGVDYAFEVIGTPRPSSQAFNMARNGGTAVAVGVSRFDEIITIPSFPLVLSEKRLLGCVYGSAQVRRDFPARSSSSRHGRLDVGAW